MAGDFTIDPRVIAAYLDDVDVDLDAAKRLVVDPPNRLAAFHLQQAAEKLVKAVGLGRGVRVTAEHNLELLVDKLPHDDAWRAKLRVLEPLSEYATTFRYPTPTGRRKAALPNDAVLDWIERIAELSREARSELATP